MLTASRIAGTVPAGTVRIAAGMCLLLPGRERAEMFVQFCHLVPPAVAVKLGLYHTAAISAQAVECFRDSGGERSGLTRSMGALFSKKKKYWVPDHRKLEDLCDDPQRCRLSSPCAPPAAPPCCLQLRVLASWRAPAWRPGAGCPCGRVYRSGVM